MYARLHGNPESEAARPAGGSRQWLSTYDLELLSRAFLPHNPRVLCLRSPPMPTIQLLHLEQAVDHLVVIAAIHFCSSFLYARQHHVMLPLLMLAWITCRNARASQAQVSAAFDASCLSARGIAGGHFSSRRSQSAPALGHWKHHRWQKSLSCSSELVGQCVDERAWTR